MDAPTLATSSTGRRDLTVTALLELAHAGRRIDGDAGVRWPWRHLHLRLEAGDRLAVVGRSGTGKTLLLRALAALDALDEGALRADGRTLDEATRAAIPAHRARVLYLAQAPALLDDLDGRTAHVLDNLRLPFALRVHAGKRFDRARAVELLAALERDESFLRARIVDLSGGERQIVAGVRALLLEPRVLLLDEPTASLDPQATASFERLIDQWLTGGSENDWADGNGRAVVWTSHDPAQLERVAARRLDLGADAPSGTERERP
ncbi:MAG: ATP-binding cassette domain-containing protein [Acidobacteriota bacterium]